MSFLGNTADSEDIVQNVYTKLMEKTHVPGILSLKLQMVTGEVSLQFLQMYIPHSSADKEQCIPGTKRIKRNIEGGITYDKQRQDQRY